MSHQLQAILNELKSIHETLRKLGQQSVSQSEHKEAPKGPTLELVLQRDVDNDNLYLYARMISEKRVIMEVATPDIIDTSHGLAMVSGRIHDACVAFGIKWLSVYSNLNLEKFSGFFEWLKEQATIESNPCLSPEELDRYVERIEATRPAKEKPCSVQVESE